MNHEGEYLAAVQVNDGNAGRQVAEEPDLLTDGEEETINGDPKFRSEEDLVNLLDRDDPIRMKLTREEHENALAIKERVEELQDLDDLPDFVYAQLAIICKDNVEDAIQRCYGMQGFRQEYKILNTVEQGHYALTQYFKTFPLDILSFSFNQDEGSYVFVHDCTKFDPKLLTSPTMEEDWFKNMYYSHILFFPDFESVRRGITCLVECEGMTMRRDVLKYFKTFFADFLAYYPFLGRCRYFHTGAMLNVIASILRRILPEGPLRDTHQVGFQFESHMSEVFLTPTVEEANQRVIARMVDCLELRYENEKWFKL